LDEDHELVVAVDAISTELDECARRIIKQAATRPAEIRLLAEVCYWAQWGDGAGHAPPGDPRRHARPWVRRRFG
jgi:hypothetical protein